MDDVSFELQAGSGLGIIGPSPSGKSSLARALVGGWIPRDGKVRLDGVALDEWPPNALNPHIGYLPQEVELFAGTVAQNISRFDLVPNYESIFSAADLAGVHGAISMLFAGYETEIGKPEIPLSAGERQKIALARALYGDPFLVVLDGPNSSLDDHGAEAFTHAIMTLRSRGAIVIVVAHSPSELQGVDQVLMMLNGKVLMIGPKEEVMRKLSPGTDRLKNRRSFGFYEDVEDGEHYQVKRIIVKSGQQLSLQRNLNGAQHWVIVRGTARVTAGDEIKLLHENETIYVPLGVVHRLENPGTSDLELIEIQTGIFREHDIVRVKVR